MKVFDCCTFYNEFDILEIRLEELWDTVDYFVIAEANTTHQGNSKPFLLKENWARFEKYASKIRHIMIEDMPVHPDTWVKEKYQRKCIERGLQDLQPDDIVIVSDCDEIPRASAIEAIKEDDNNYDRYILAIPLNYYRFNFMMLHPHCKQNNIIVTRGRVFTDPQNERAFTFTRGSDPMHYAEEGYCVIEHGGWHFTYFGQTDHAKNKIKNFAHAETNVPHIMDKLDVDYMIANKVGLLGFEYHERFVYTIVDDYFPQTILNNLEKYKDMIVPGATQTVYDFYPE